MKIIKLHRAFFLMTSMLLLSSCIREYYDIEQEDNNHVLVELFTRSAAKNIPVSRASANETEVGRTPWVLVFKDDGTSSYKFEEAKQAYYLTSIQKTYINLTKQNVPCKILIIANPQNNFYIKNNNAFVANPFTSENIEEALGGKTLETACSILYTEPLSAPQTTVPFLSEALPMSLVFDLPGGITADTRISQKDIGDNEIPLELTNVVAKLIVENEAGNFVFEGITAVINAPRRTPLYRLTSVDPVKNDNQELIEYRINSYSGDIAIANGNTQSTEENPVYLFESKTGSTGGLDTYIIIRGKYQGQECYYKMAIVDSDKDGVDIIRNHLYVFTIEKVEGMGHESAGEAIAAPAFNNTKIYADLKTANVDAYETTAFDTYYMSVSNSEYIVYGNLTNDLTAFTLVTYSAGTTMTGTITMPTGLLSSTSTWYATGTEQAIPVTITMQSSFTSGEIVLKLGNIKKTISVEKRTAWANGATKIARPSAELGFYCVSGTTETSWIKFYPSTNGRDDTTGNITVDDGIIQIKRESGTGTGTFYLSTIKNPASGNVGEDASRRIKVDIVN